jgi:hypothetical protein
MKTNFLKSIHGADIGLVVSNLLVFLYLFPLLILGQNSYVGINDHLDAHVIWYRILASNGMVFADSFAPVSEIMNAPRLSLGNEFFLVFWLHYFFDTFPAIVINKFVIHFTGLWGMYLLLNQLKLSRLAVFVGTMFFAMLPFSQYWGISIAGQPLVFYLLLNIDEKGVTAKHVILLVIYVLYSNFYSVTGFFFAAVIAFFCTKFVKERFVNRSVIGIISLLVLASIAMEYRLIYAFFFSNSYISARVERTTLQFPIDFLYVPKLILLGDSTARSLMALAIPLLICSAALKVHNKIKSDWRISFVLFLFTVIFIFSAGLQLNSVLKIFRHSAFNAFQFDRIYTLLPFMAAISMACATDYIIAYSRKVGPPLVAYVTIVLSTTWIANPILRPFLPITNTDEFMSFRSFFAEGLFGEIKRYIGTDEKSYKVASLGLYPAIAQYNHFHSIDGYLPNYPLLYKHEFRKIIQGELADNDDIRIYFDYWGARCYLFDNELGLKFFITKKRSLQIKEFNINCNQFKKMGGKFIISTVPIQSFQCPGSVKFHRSFEDEHWKIYLYEII